MFNNKGSEERTERERDRGRESQKERVISQLSLQNALKNINIHYLDDVIIAAFAR